MSGAISPDEVKQILFGLGFEEIAITPKQQSEQIIRDWNIGQGAENVVFSAYIHARKPSPHNEQPRSEQQGIHSLA